MCITGVKEYFQPQHDWLLLRFASWAKLFRKVISSHFTLLVQKLLHFSNSMYIFSEQMNKPDFKNVKLKTYTWMASVCFGARRASKTTVCGGGTTEAWVLLRLVNVGLSVLHSPVQFHLWHAACRNVAFSTHVICTQVLISLNNKTVSLNFLQRILNAK